MLVWERFHSDNHYQLRRAGHSLRLYRNGVFHSQYNGQRLLNGGVWDMLWLPLWFRPSRQRQRILMLGVGAGAAAKKILDSGFDGHLVGIELDPVHLQIARKHIGLASHCARVELHSADAFDWLRRYKGSAFDIIIDDLYLEQSGEPQRQLGGGFSQAGWLACQRRHLKPAGLLLANCDSRPALNQLVATSRQQSSFAHAMVFSVPHYQNRIALMSRSTLEPTEYWQQLESDFGPGATRQIRRAGLSPRRLKLSSD